MSDPALEVSLIADGVGEDVGEEGGLSSVLATTSSTSPLAFCRIDIAC